jgi:hypothetical protein
LEIQTPQSTRLTPALRRKVFVDNLRRLCHAPGEQTKSMKPGIKIVLTIITVTGLWLSAAGTLMGQVLLGCSISGTIMTQGVTVDDGAVTRLPAKSTLTTASILKQLASDEKAGGLWTNDTFPAGAKLNYFTGESSPYYPQFATPAEFQVVDRHNNLLLVVTNILTLTNVGTNGIDYGSATETTVQLATLTYDATSVGRTNKYTVTGLGTSTTSNTAANFYGEFTQTDTFSLQNGTGEGVNANGVSIVLTGVTITESGSARLNNGAGLSGFEGTAAPVGDPPTPSLAKQAD